MPNQSNKAQFLIELLIAMAIFSIALVAIAALNVGGIRLFKTARMETLLQGCGSDLARGMINGIPGGSHGLIGAKSIQTGDDANIVFTDKNDRIIRYYLESVYKRPIFVRFGHIIPNPRKESTQILHTLDKNATRIGTFDDFQHLKK